MENNSQYQLEATYFVYLYTEAKYKQLTFETERTYEYSLRQLCKKLGFTPVTCTLFAFRDSQTGNFLPGCDEIQPSMKLDLRLRFQVPKLQELLRMDPNAFDYFYHQAKHDVVNNLVKEVEYPNHKEKIVGLGVTSMYIDMIEKGKKADELLRDYKTYFPRKHRKEHRYVLRAKVENVLRKIVNLDHVPNDVKRTFLESVFSMAPNYLIEEYTGIVPEYSENSASGHSEHTVEAQIKFTPFGKENGGLFVYYSRYKEWKHIANIEDFIAIIREENGTIRLEKGDSNFIIVIKDKQKGMSFLSLLAGYYRLMVKWTVNVVKDLYSPHLKTLQALKCHGPIGGEYSYSKLDERRSCPGAYIIRECEKEFDNYYIDIVVKIRFETFRIIEESNKWKLQLPNMRISVFDNLNDLVKSIETDKRQKFRLAPTEHDKSPLLLLCLPPQQTKKKQLIDDDNESKLRKQPARIFSTKELIRYVETKHLVENGIINEMRAEWVLNEETKVAVTMRILTISNYVKEMMDLTEKWNQLSSPELIKFYGFSLSTPMIVTESTWLGSLDQILPMIDVSEVSLIDAAYSLTRALFYLHEKNFVHGRIRCSTLKVIRYCSPDQIMVRLADPGFLKNTKEDYPWIPPEFRLNKRINESNKKMDIYAYATTLWQIFADGREPTLEELEKTRPVNCPRNGPDLFKVVRRCWASSTDSSFSLQWIFFKLICARDAAINSKNVNWRPFNEDEAGYESDSSGADESRDEILDYELEQTNFKNETILNNYQPKLDDDQNKCIELPDHSKLIYGKQVGSGHYGCVFEGILEPLDSDPIKVAIKRLKEFQKGETQENMKKDFMREIEIMQRLKHQNIVRILSSAIEPETIIVMEFVEHSSLSSYLSFNSPKLENTHLLEFARDIANGMDYLAGKNIVHRDLAARNILVDSDHRLKISDFGLAQFADDNGYYKLQHNRHLPLKWYAPETLIEQKYSFYSDVWSYGVTLFEMFSRGQEPNLIPAENFNEFELIKELKNGKRLKCPPQCTPQIYNELMMKCWEFDPKRRPSFKVLLDEIDDLIQNYGK